jgi:hypothetical protein
MPARGSSQACRSPWRRRLTAAMTLTNAPIRLRLGGAAPRTADFSMASDPGLGYTFRSHD